MNTDDGGHVIVIYEVVKTNGKVTQINMHILMANTGLIKDTLT